MTERLTLEIVDCAPVAGAAVEIVERKGVGHPDYICDAALDQVAVALSREYNKRFGTVLHHNIDKGLLVAGSVEKGFGGGRVVRPMELIVGDRATFEAGGEKVPVDEIAVETVKGWFRKNLKHVDPDEHLTVRSALAPGSVELADIFDRKGKVRAANDTSAAVGYAPLTPTERVVLETERFINSPAFKLDFPETGSDVKVMGIRTGRDLDITAACPLMAGLVRSEADYFEKKSAVAASVRKFLAGFDHGGAFEKVKLNLNTLDAKGEGVSGVYLSLLGTSAEDADSGQVGRGNRVNGVISLNRPMGTEAAAGKNPVSHVGKIYNVMAHKMAGELYERCEGISEVYVWLLSQIGSPVDRPKHVYVRMVTEGRPDRRTLDGRVRSIVDEFLSGTGVFTAELARGEYPVC